jgi:hypothetical protein
MPKAKITKKDGYKCAPNGHTVVTYPFGSEVDGQVAEWALAAHAASRVFDSPVKEAKVTGPTETKTRTRKAKK